MKKIFITLIIIATAFIFTSVAFCETHEPKEEAVESGICPITKVQGKLKDCLECHTKKTFEIIESIPFEHWILPGYQAKMILEDGVPVGVYEMHGTVDGSEGTSFDEFLNYLNSCHKEVKKIIIDIHSPGGSLFGGFQFVGVMKNWQSKGYTIETRINGFAASAAFFIFCAGNPRFVSPQSELMWHEIITFRMFDISGPADKEDQAAVLRHLQDTANSMIAEMSNLTKDEIDSKIRKKEYWINGKDALEFGFATGLME